MKKKEKVPYDDALADDLIARHGLAPTVKKVWKSRGHIPGDYLDDNRDTSNRLGDRNPDYQKYIAILSRKEISATKFRCLAQKGADIQRSKDRMSEAEALRFRDEITEIRNTLRTAKDVPTNRNILKALQDVRLKPTHIIEKNLYAKLLRDGFLTEIEKREIQAAIMALYNLLRI